MVTMKKMMMMMVVVMVTMMMMVTRGQKSIVLPESHQEYEICCQKVIVITNLFPKVKVVNNLLQPQWLLISMHQTIGFISKNCGKSRFREWNFTRACLILSDHQLVCSIIVGILKLQFNFISKNCGQARFQEWSFTRSCLILSDFSHSKCLSSLPCTFISPRLLTHLQSGRGGSD